MCKGRPGVRLCLRLVRHDVAVGLGAGVSADVLVRRKRLLRALVHQLVAVAPVAVVAAQIAARPSLRPRRERAVGIAVADVPSEAALLGRGAVLGR